MKDDKYSSRIFILADDEFIFLEIHLDTFVLEVLTIEKGVKKDHPRFVLGNNMNQ